MRKALLGVMTATAVIVAAACSSGGGGGGGTNSPTPTPPKWSFTAHGTGFGGQSGNAVGLRILHGATVVYCTTSGAVTGNNFTVIATSAMTNAMSYSGEVFEDKDGDSAFTAGDEAFAETA